MHFLWKDSFHISLVNSHAFCSHLTDDGILILIVNAGKRCNPCWQEQGSHHFRAILLCIACTSGRVPTKDISPLRTFTSCGNSSKRTRRMKFPTFVIRLSFAEVTRLPFFISIRHHGPEFPNLEMTVVLGYPHLLVNNWTLAI